MAVTKMLRVYSHPRSGTAFLAAMLKRNFYQHVDTTDMGGVAGHFAHRIRVDSSLYGKLSGNHLFPTQVAKCFYIFRDGRDVILSLWRTKMMIHPNDRDLSLAEYMRKPIDWRGTPGKPARKAYMTIAEHWMKHLRAWHRAEYTGKVRYVRYEELVLNPAMIMAMVARHIGVNFDPDDLELVPELVGLAPNEGKIGAWREHFSDDDIAFFHGIVPKDFWGLW